MDQKNIMEDMGDLTLVRNKQQAIRFYVAHSLKGLLFASMLWIIQTYVLGADERSAKASFFVVNAIYTSWIYFQMIEQRFKPMEIAKDPEKLKQQQMTIAKYRISTLIPTLLALATTFVGFAVVAYVSTKKFGDYSRVEE